MALKIPPKDHNGPWLEIDEGTPTGDPEMVETLAVALESAERNFEADVQGWHDRIGRIKKQLTVERQAARGRKVRAGQSARSSRQGRG